MPSLRRRVYEIVEPGVSDALPAQVFQRLSAAAIVASVLAVTAATMPALDPEQAEGLRAVEWLCGTFFVVEYLLRLFAAAEHPLYGRKGGLRAMLDYARTPLMILDLLGLVPLLLALFVPQATGTIMLLQMLRFFRLARYSPALAIVGRVVATEWRALTATGIIGFGMLLLAATGMYIVEHDAQPDKFSSIPGAMYWAIVTLATVGYGDVVPVTVPGKMVTAVVIVSGLIFFALPIAIIASSFLAEMRRRDFNISYSLVARVPLFARLDAIEISELASLLKSRRVPRDQVVVRKGDPGESMFFIAHGTVEVLLQNGGVMLGEGDFFGEMAVLGRRARAATVVARRTCDLLVLDAADLLQLVERNPHVHAELQAVMAARQPASV